MLRITLATLLVAVAAASALNVHPERQALIDEINSKQSLWTAAAHPRFADKAPGASKPMLGVHMEKNRNATLRMLQTGEVVQAPLFSKEFIANLPTEFDSAANWPQCAKSIDDIRDQSACGCCWAFGAAEAASDRLCIATNASTLVPLSAQDMCFCASFNGCDGGELAPAWSHIQRNGLVTGGQNKGIGPFGTGYCSAFSLPHCHHHGPQGSDPYPDEGTPGCPTVSRSPSCPRQCDSTATAPHNNFDSDKYSFQGRVVSYPADADQIAAAIMTGGPVEVAFSVYSDFENYAGGIYKHTGGSMLGGHAVRMVGWGEENGTKYWKIANSWNPYWGEKGYFRIVRGTNECGIEGDVVSADNSATWGKKSDL